MGTISERLTKLLEYKGITAYLLSKNTGVAQSSISRILKNNSKPNRNTITLICKYFNINEVWFLTGNGDQWIEKESLTPEMKADLSHANNEILNKLNILIKKINETSPGSENLKEALELQNEIEADLPAATTITEKVHKIENNLQVMQTNFVRLFKMVNTMQAQINKNTNYKSTSNES